LVLLEIITFQPAEPEILLQFSHRNDAARRFDWPACLRASTTGQTNRRKTNLDGHALNGRFANPATPQPFRPLRFSNRPFSAGANLRPASDCGIYFFGENDVLQSNEKAGGGKPDGGYSQGTRKPGSSSGRTTTGFTGGRRREVADHEFQTGCPRNGQTLGLTRNGRRS